MTELFYCTCRCGCTTVIAGMYNPGCKFCMNDQEHRKALKIIGINKANQFNPFTVIKNGN